MKKQIIVKTLSFAVFIVLCFLAISECADILEYKAARIKYTPFFESKTNFDVILLGTSHMHNHILPMEMWHEYGIASYNWGYSNCTPAVYYYLLQDIIKYTTPKLVVIDIHGVVEYERYNNGKYRTDRIEQQHVQFDSFPIWSLNKIKASRDVFDDYADNEDFIWNFIMYHNRWSELGKNDFKYTPTTEKGAEYLAGFGEGSFKLFPDNEKTEIDSVCFPYFKKTLEFCQNQGIQVLCVCLPYRADETSQKVANSIGEVITQYQGCSYVNTMGLELVDYKTDLFSDTTHMNYSGASKLTYWIGKYIRDHYTLDDYSNNEFWIEDYRAYMKYKTKKICDQSNLPEYLVLLRDKAFTGKLEVYNQSILTSEKIMALCNNAGITPVFVKSDNDKCAKLSIQLSSTGEEVQEVLFKCDEEDNIDIMKIVKEV